jgi:hypothetical protein
MGHQFGVDTGDAGILELLGQHAGVVPLHALHSSVHIGQLLGSAEVSQGYDDVCGVG